MHENVFKHTTCECELSFINIWEDDEINANINDLVVALSWCLENNVTLINLSLGTTRFSDISELFDIIKKLVKKNIIIVAASSNANRLTFPASFDQVIAVKALEGVEKTGFIYQESSIDLIEISCYVEDEVITYKDQQYYLGAANSLAAPIISAKVYNFISDGYNSFDQIKQKLKEAPLHISYNQDEKIYEKYLMKKIEIPIIAIINHCHSENFNAAALTQKLLMEFFKQDYQGVCLRENGLTDFSKKTLNLMDFEKYNPVEKLNFYAHYCNVDYVIVEGSKAFLFGDLRSVEFDIILHHSDLNNINVTREVPCITFSECTDLAALFFRVYNYLSG